MSKSLNNTSRFGLSRFFEDRSGRGTLSAAIIAIFTELVLGSLVAGGPPLAFIARIFCIFVVLVVIYEFCLGRLRREPASIKDLSCLVTVTIGAVGSLWLWEVLSLSISTYAAHANWSLLKLVGRDAIFFSVPLAAGGLTLQSVLGLQFGLVYALTLSTIAGVYIPSLPLFAPCALVTALIACRSITRLRNRLSFLRAGLYIMLATLFFSIANSLFQGSLSHADLLVRVVAAVGSGVFTVLVAAGGTPVAEYIWGYVTDIRLIEMATLDHPLLKELSVQAPGTWNHSMVMGIMAEAAAESIGANSVLARVGCYFHDVGKTKKPLYFVENQTNGENRHDKLSPSMSALIIRSHVKEGIELARRYHLPKILVDMIPQHHGTSLIEYFYEKAVKEAAAEGKEVDRALYTYPGPRPQTREAGILMLADGIEAASRTLSDPSPDRIQGMVQKMINKVFVSGELAECELTLQDLHQIAKCFTRVLSAIYHQRISYSEPAEKVTPRVSSEGAARESGVKEQTKGDISSGRTEGENSSANEDRRTDSEEKLKRLGMEV